MKVRFADVVVAKVVKFDVEDLCFGLLEGDPRTFIQRRIAEDRERATCTSLYVIPPGPKRRTMLGGNGISTSTVVYNELPTYRYKLVCEHQAKSFEIVWYDDAPLVYAGIYDVFQAVAGGFEFNKYAEFWG
jgi:hypothetical protein